MHAHTQPTQTHARTVFFVTASDAAKSAAFAVWPTCCERSNTEAKSMRLNADACASE